MTDLRESYLRAVSDGDLRASVRSTSAAGDVVGAVALMSRTRPLAAGLLRMLGGDDGAALDVLRIMARMCVGKSYRAWTPIGEQEALGLSAVVLSWHRDGTCRACQGRRMLAVPNTPVLSGKECKVCRGTGRVSLRHQVSPERWPLAEWLSDELKREQGAAKGAARRKLCGEQRQ